MLGTTLRYAIPVPGSPGCHAPPEVIVVLLTGETGPRGEPVYADSTGRYRFSISGETAEMLSGPPEEAAAGRRCFQAVPLP